MKQNRQTTSLASFNMVIERAYGTILKQAKLLLATIERDELRSILERKNSLRTPDTIVHELVSPLLYLRLFCEHDGTMAIRFGIEPIKDNNELDVITAQFLRALFKHTSKENTEFDIEQCIRTDWFINSCNNLYEYIDMQQKYHTLKMIPYKVSSVTRKKILSVV